VTESTKPPVIQTLLRQAAFSTAAIGAAQPLLAVASVVTNSTPLTKMHGGLGYVFAAGAVVTLVLAILWTRRGAPTMALKLALLVAVGAGLQTYWGLLSTPAPGRISGGVVGLHMGLGLLLAFGAAVLYSLARDTHRASA